MRSIRIFLPSGNIYRNKDEVMELQEKEVRNLGIIKNGICGTCIWEIDDEMTLTMRPQDGKSGVVESDDDGHWPWWPYRAA